MAKGTAKAGTAGRFGARYGVVVRKLTRDIEKVEKARYECPTCHHASVRRKASGIWECGHCETKFAAASYSPQTKKITAEDEVHVEAEGKK
ncbi:MAG: 50S ribosomal protein L37ae [Methanomassiliicoccales archaeon]|jgi:large subunit ribosomal protein L37Ae|nr:50S ribosomal protein L37ae [Methanomassiliicoccales archaeon]